MPQWFTLVWVFSSQPSVRRPLQSSKGMVHWPMSHCPATQRGVAFITAQTAGAAP